MPTIVFVVEFVVVFVVGCVISDVNVSSDEFVGLIGVTTPYVSEVTIRNIAIPISCKICSFFICCYLLQNVNKFFDSIC